MLEFGLIIVIEILSFIVLKECFNKRPGRIFYSIAGVHLILSIWLWYLLFRYTCFKGPYDTAGNIWIQLNLMGMICAVVFPRVILLLIHFTGRFLKIRKRELLTNAGLVISAVIFSVVAAGTLAGRFNFKIEEVTIRIKRLPAGLEGIRIVHLSDLHLSGFHTNMHKLEKAIKIANSLSPDLILNTGDFVSYGWREFGRCDTILNKEVSRFGKYAVLGNHDMGTYLPGSTEERRAEVVENMTRQIKASGYRLLNNENLINEINGVRVAFIGVTTSGSHPDIIHGSILQSIAGTESADFRILLAHDPNQWMEDVAGKTNIELTLSGHTHGMQMGIITKRFRWSPSKYFYPHWNGLYSKGEQYHYVNRGLGVLAIPFRIWMPPEITLIKLEAG
jgi:hypothetical protein